MSVRQAQLLESEQAADAPIAADEIATGIATVAPEEQVNGEAEAADSGNGEPLSSLLGVPSSLEDIAALAEARLRETLSQIDEMRRTAQVNRARLEAELQVQRRRSASAEERLRQIEVNLEQSRGATEEQRVSNAELTTILRAAEHRLSTLEKTLKARDEQIAALRSAEAIEVEQLQVQRQHLEVRLAEAQRDLHATRERIKAETATLQQERSELAAQVETLERRLQSRNEEVQQLMEQLQRLREAVTAESTTAGGEPGAAARRLLEIEKNFGAAVEREQAQSEELRRLTQRCEELDAQLVRREHRCRELEELAESRAREVVEQREATEALARDRGDLQMLIDSLTFEVKQLRRDLVEAGQMERQAVEQRRLFEGRVGELEAALRAGNDQAAIMQASLAEAQVLLQKEQMTATSLRGELQSQVRLLQALEADLTEARTKASALELQLHSESQQHIKQLAKATERGHEMEAERDALKEELRNLTALKERLERELDQQRRRAEMERQKAEMARLQAKLEEIESRHPEALQRPGEAPNGSRQAEVAAAPPALQPTVRLDFPIFAIGASTGGPAALGEVLRLLTQDFPGAILVVQHMPAGYTAEMAAMLDQNATITVVEARHGDALRPGMAFVAPGGHHMVIRDGQIHLTSGPPVNKHRPSVDVLFESLIPVASQVCAVLLTGMGSDGVIGMQKLLEAGADTVVQNEASCVVWGMPGAAVKAGCAQRQLTPAEIGRYIIERAALFAAQPAAAQERARS